MEEVDTAQPGDDGEELAIRGAAEDSIDVELAAGNAADEVIDEAEELAVRGTADQDNAVAPNVIDDVPPLLGALPVDEPDEFSAAPGQITFASTVAV